MLASRTRMRPTNSRPTSPRSCVPAPGVSRAVVVSLKFPPPALRGRLHDPLLLRVTLKARFGLEVPAHGLGGDEDEARVGLRRPRDPAGDLVQVELHHRQEALQIGLLIDGEVYMALAHELQDLRRQVVTAGFDPLFVQAGLLHHLGYALGAARVHGEHPCDVLVAVVPGLDAATFLRYIGARGDLLDLDVRPRVLYGLPGAVYARLDVELPRRRDKERYQPLADEADDALAHLHAGLEQVLAYVRKRRVGPRSLAVGVVGDDRDALVERVLDRVIESHRIHHRNGDAVYVARDGRVHRVHHLPYDRLLGSRPLRRRAQQRLSVLDAVLRRYEERVCGHVADEDEVPLGRVREVSTRAARPPTALARLLGRLLPAPAQEQPCRCQRAR